MKNILTRILTAGALLAAVPALCTASIPGGSAMKFHGFGADTGGGRGGRVIKVTTLDASGPGSLEEALDESGPRVIVFEVGGIIDFRKDEYEIQNGFVTIAGETAPAPGITIIRGSLTVATNDVIIRHIRVRCGDGGDLKTPGWQPDAMGASGPKVKNVLFDHCSAAWSIDESLSVSGPREKNGTSSNVTIRNCIVAEGLDNSTHPKGPHSKGTLIHDFVHDVAIVGNLYAAEFNRNPYLKPNTKVFMANNVIYNPGSAAVHFAWVPNEYNGVIKDPMLPSQLTAIANVYRMGQSTHKNLPMFTVSKDAVLGTGRLYQRDSNVYDPSGKLIWDGSAANAASQIVKEVTIVDHPMLQPDNFTPLPVEQTEAYVLKNAGARPMARDEVDQRIIKDYLNRTGKIIDSQDQVGGYPKAAPTYRKLEVPAKASDIEPWLEGYRSQVEY